MSISYRKRIAITGACLGLAAFGSLGFTERAGAQEVAVTAPTTQGGDRIADEKLRKRVKDALHSDPYFYDEHVTVSIEGGAVVLHGFVSSAWDLQDALRIASKAAGDTRVIDKLSIKLGGR